MKIQSSSELGLIIRRERQKLGWTQADLAQQIGVKPLWISQFERGKDTAQVGLVLRALKAIGGSISFTTTRTQSEHDGIAQLAAILGEPAPESFDSAESASTQNDSQE